MAFDGHKNFAYSLVASAPSPALSGTSLVVGAGEGANFPATPFNATVWPVRVQPSEANAEVVRVTAISTDTLTITRAQEGSVARSILIGDQIAATITTKLLTDLEGKFPVVNADLATEAQATLKGRAAAAGTGAVTDLTATQVRTILDTNTTPSTQAIGDAAAVGTADTLARGDHSHAMPPAAAIYALAQSINVQTGTTYTHVLSDSGKLITLDNAAAVTFTVDSNATVATPIGTRISLAQIGAGQVTLVGAGGVTINSTPTLKIVAQYGCATLLKIGTDTWLLFGDLALT